MIDLNDFAELEYCLIKGDGSPLEKVEEAFSFGPDWIPDDYKQIFTRCDCWYLDGVGMFSPVMVPYSASHRAQIMNEDFHELCPGHDDFFVLGDAGDNSYLVLQHTEDGDTCGFFHIYDDDWWDKQFPSFTDWAYACLEAEGSPND